MKPGDIYFFDLVPDRRLWVRLWRWLTLRQAPMKLEERVVIMAFDTGVVVYR